MLTVQLKIQSLLNKLWVEYDVVFKIDQQRYKKKLITFWGDLDHHAGSSYLES